MQQYGVTGPYLAPSDFEQPEEEDIIASGSSSSSSRSLSDADKTQQQTTFSNESKTIVKTVVWRFGLVVTRWLRST